VKYQVHGQRRVLFRKIEKCSICGVMLYNIPRYRVYLILRKGPLEGVMFKKLHVCDKCLECLKRDQDVRKVFKLRYRKMPVLELDELSLAFDYLRKAKELEVKYILRKKEEYALEIAKLLERASALLDEKEPPRGYCY